MTASSIAAPAARTHSIARTGIAHRQVVGFCFFAAGVILLMGIITAEALYPLPYTTFGNEISDLGGTRPPEGLVFQPSVAARFRWVPRRVE